MIGPLHIGHSVRLLGVGELGKALGLNWGSTIKLLGRLGVPFQSDYGPEPVINMAAFEAAAYADLSPSMPADIVRLHQAIAALDHVVLDRKALKSRLLAYLRYLNRSSKGGRMKDD